MIIQGRATKETLRNRGDGVNLDPNFKKSKTLKMF